MTIDQLKERLPEIHHYVFRGRLTAMEILALQPGSMIMQVGLDEAGGYYNGPGDIWLVIRIPGADTKWSYFSGSFVGVAGNALYTGYCHACDMSDVGMVRIA